MVGQLFRMAMRCLSCLATLLLLLLPHHFLAQAVAVPLDPAPGLSVQFYAKSCPLAQTIVARRVASAVAADVTIGPPLLRLLFHDCFVRGCDASIMLNGMIANTNELAAVPNQSVRGQAVIDDVKTHLEAACPGVVSCADVIALAAREAVRVLGGPFIPLRLGRRDGLVSMVNDAGVLPSSHANVTTLLKTFNSVGLNMIDLVTLSGAHTIGRGLCTRLQQRFTPPDPTLAVAYRRSLQLRCGGAGANFKPQTQLLLDPVSPFRFDNQYFKNLIARRGLFTSDEVMMFDLRTQRLIEVYAQNQPLFFRQFAISLRKMSEIQVLTGNVGQVRHNCRAVNAL